ncbi:unnamed protein product [Schistosoma mansoni]|uniref:Smp_201180 n=1 Tax=Schistosoma mansoni TaxID=6183 RepID=UPI00022C83E9|nr:unnamed protein product [Schistosoma mansoni]|eukprot:XP_018644962.1 unnamed protein product [Schistosoma mansoni]
MIAPIDNSLFSHLRESARSYIRQGTYALIRYNRITLQKYKCDLEIKMVSKCPLCDCLSFNLFKLIKIGTMEHHNNYLPHKKSLN